MPPAGKRRVRSGKKKSASSSSTRKPRVVKGRLALRVAGYSGLQKIAPSSLIPYLPVSKLRQAAKRALGASGKKKTVRRRKRTKAGKGGKRRRR